MDYVFNRACMEHAYSDLASAQRELSSLLAAMASIDASFHDEELPAFRIFEDPWLITVSDINGASTSLGDVAHRLYEIDATLADYFGQLQRMTPPDLNFTEAEVESALSISVQEAAQGHDNCFHHAQAAEADAVLCASGANMILVSLCNEGRWDTDHMAFASGHDTYSVDHVAQGAHAQRLTGRLRAAVRSTTTPRQLWEARFTLFPNLFFGPGVERGLKSFSAKIFPLLIKRLTDLDTRAHHWTSTGLFPNALPPIKDESEPTMNKYGDSRCFKDENGEDALFSEHIWIDSYHRIHLRRDDQNRRLVIAYIGTHLPTVKYPT